jgi:hypothetical protein
MSAATIPRGKNPAFRVDIGESELAVTSAESNKKADVIDKNFFMNNLPDNVYINIIYTVGRYVKHTRRYGTRI